MAFVGFLRANTAATLKLGPFLDSTDGNTDETALTISQADVRLSKNGGNYAQKNEATSATHDELGKYDCPIDATDTNTYGRLNVIVHETGGLTVDQDYIVLAEPVYDSFCPAATGNPLPAFGILDWGTAQASAAGTLVHRAGLNLANDIPNGSTEYVYSGTGAGQSRVTHDFDNATDTSSVSPDWTTTPSTDSLYVTLASPPQPTNAAALPSVSLPTGAIAAATFAAGAIDAAALAADATTELQAGLLTATSANTTRYQKNAASQKVFFTLVDSTDHVTRKAGITVTAQRSLDGAAFGSATGTVTEVGSGVYYLSASAADTNADDVVFRFTGAACDPVEVAVVTYA